MKAWARLLAEAEAVLGSTLAALPAEIRKEADTVPVVFQEICPDDPEILGRYEDFQEGEISAARGPILLYLVAIAEYCEDEGLEYAEEVRLTYLHELGHHLGWDEGELEARGLE